MENQLSAKNSLESLEENEKSIVIYEKYGTNSSVVITGSCIWFAFEGSVEIKTDSGTSLLNSNQLLITTGSKFLITANAFSGVRVGISNIQRILPIEVNEKKCEYNEDFISLILKYYRLGKGKNKQQIIHHFTRLKDNPNSIVLQSTATEIILDVLKKDIFLFYRRLGLIKRKRMITKLEILKRLENIKDEIEQSCPQKFSLEKVCRNHCISKYSMIRSFKAVFEITPYHYYLKQKISKAKSLLSQGYSVKETSEKCGYPDIFSFSKQFKLSEGYPPSFAKCTVDTPKTFLHLNS